MVAPSKLQKSASDRVKTDAKGALHLARLLRLDEVTAVTPTVEIETARGLVRARGMRVLGRCGPGTTAASGAPGRPMTVLISGRRPEGGSVKQARSS